jgi:RNA polymerase sigma-70 factor (subfamily 1)
MDSNVDEIPDLNAFRSYLTVLARGQIPISMQSRLDASDIVQETLLEAHRKRHQFQGGGEPRQLAGWLRQLLSCNLLDALKTQHRDLRDVRREQSIPLSIDESAMGLENMLVASDTSPSQQFDKQFRATLVAQAIEALPVQQRDAIMLRYFQKASLQDMSDSMQKSTSAVAGILKRGLAALRERLQKDKA